ncbi:glycosyltransferase [Clostridium sartagoforme]|uniref:Glycosyltransferase n=1 Tax=Clostridium sartagoforme TaxID=84031 RepID=A0A4S2DN40_9CLOT|nr:glycosyltransferase family 4 protein [Clostridium sartagoforme]TGY42444.1 glycosyltransferase [Clostridium sartagoforme]
MKICYVTHLPNLTGANQSLLDILSKNKREKVEAVVLLGKHGPLEKELEKINIRYEVIPYSSEIKEPRKILRNIAKKVKNYFAIFKIKKFFIKEEFDIIHNNSLLVGVGMKAAYKLRIPYICHIREFVVDYHNVSLLNEKKQFDLAKNSNKVIAISESVKNKFSPILNKKKIEVLFDGINIEKYILPNHIIFQNNLETNDGVINVLLAGRISPGKGQLDAIKAVEIIRNKINNEKVKNIKDINLYIVGGIGDNNYYQKMIKYISDNKIEGIHIIDFCNDLKKLREKCDIGLTCSIFEALGRVTIENMLGKLLVIGADTDGTIEIINEQTGLLYKYGDFEELADKIIFAVNNKEKMIETACNGQEYANDKFDSNSYNSELYKIYESII